MFGQSQEAIIFFHDGTSIKGYGSIASNYKIKFRTSLDKKADTWPDLMVKGIIFYGFEAKLRFEYKYDKPLKTWPLLLEVIEEGNVNIYVDSHIATVYIPIPGRYGFGLKTLDFKKNKIYFKKPFEDEVIRFNKEFYKEKAVKYFEKCTSLVERIENEKFKKHKILDFLYHYNDCSNEIFDD